MATKAGVWIDHRQAIVVLVTDAGKEIKKIRSGIEKPVRSAGRSSSKNKYTPNDFVADDRLEHKFVNHLKEYYDEVIACICGAEAILILGPGEAKGEFSKRIQSKNLCGGIVELETTDKMTDRQIAAKVGQHFATATANRSVAPKKTAKKKATKATSGKRTTKSGKYSMRYGVR